MTDPLYERLALEWQATLASGAYLTETDSSFYSGQNGWEPIQPKTTMERLALLIAEHFDTTVKVMKSDNRAVSAMRPRWVFIHMVREHAPSRNQSDIARFLNRDHTTIGHALKAIENLQGESWFREACDAVRARL